MSLFSFLDKTDSIQTLIKKAFAIKNDIQQRLTEIQDRSGKQVITTHQYTLQLSPSSATSEKRTLENHLSDDIQHSFELDDLFVVADNPSTKTIDDAIESWRYKGEALGKEKIAVDDFIDRKLEGFRDVVRLHKDYERLLYRYSRFLAEDVESRMAVNILLSNLEILQDAIGEIHALTHDVPDEVDSEEDEDEDEDVESIMKSLSKSLKTLQSKVPDLKVDLQFQLPKKVQVNETTRIKLKGYESEHVDGIHTLQPFESNEKEYLASVSYDATINIWDLSQSTLVTSLTGHTRCINTLTMFAKNGVQILVSGSSDSTIKLWDTSNNKNIQTLKGHDYGIRCLKVYENDGEMFLVSASDDTTIMIWDLVNCKNIAKLQGHESNVNILSVFYHDGKPYLASGSLDRTINIWSLSEYKLARTLKI